MGHNIQLYHTAQVDCLLSRNNEGHLNLILYHVYFQLDNGKSVSFSQNEISDNRPIVTDVKCINYKKLSSFGLTALILLLSYQLLFMIDDSYSYRCVVTRIDIKSKL